MWNERLSENDGSDDGEWGGTVNLLQLYSTSNWWVAY